MNMENKLFGKTVIWNGDSICQGSSRWGTWADRIAAKNSLAAWKNYGIGGGTVTENVLVASTGKIRHSVSATLEKMHEEFPDADYIIFEGGTNDADLLGRITEGDVPARFGALDPYDYSGNYDRDSFCGALAVALTEGKTIKEAVRLANGMGALTVGVKGAIPSLHTREQVEEFLRQHTKN